MDQLQNLELLRLGGNQLTEIPAKLWTLPKLSWLTISGNPLMDQIQKDYAPTYAELPTVTMKDLNSTGKDLGEGASGKVGLYKWENKDVAVKIIHGVTSDGRAEDELSIYKMVGSSGMDHRVVGCIGLLDDTDTDPPRKGVVMEPLPSNLEDLALPPTILEVTADRWTGTKTGAGSKSASFVKNVLMDSVRALRFLHQRRIAHGDFYAHNMKVDWDTGRVHLLDFGASYYLGDHHYAALAEKLEVRAYGILVKEMMVLLDVNNNSKEKENALKDRLESLYEMCVHESVSSRPSFSAVEEYVKALMKKK